MNSFFTYKKNGKLSDVSWISSGIEITVGGLIDPVALLSTDRKFIVIEDWARKKILIYLQDGTNVHEIDISHDKYDYRGINKCNKSSSGIAIIVIPKDDSLRTEHDDFIQLEVDLDNMRIGEKVAIYR